MGTKYHFTCNSCGYKIVTSGGADRGFVAITNTIHCNDCGSVSDVVVGDATTEMPDWGSRATHSGAA